MSLTIEIMSMPTSSSLLACLAIGVTLVGIVIASILTYLKYKLDQANYNKDLFEERYKIFTTVKNIFVSVNKREYEVMSVAQWEELTLKAYALFGEETYEFIKKFQENATAHVKTKPLDRLLTQETVLAGMNKDISGTQESVVIRNQVDQFFVELADPKVLLSHFPELKLTVYQGTVWKNFKTFCSTFFAKFICK